MEQKFERIWSKIFIREQIIQYHDHLHQHEMNYFSLLMIEYMDKNYELQMEQSDEHIYLMILVLMEII
ncbi:TPA: hypothetical protein DIC40_08580 [Patescibacteria group bacterium]|nr:hypothetical protein [Candidatus Gracilibacteria bacterium]